MCPARQSSSRSQRRSGAYSAGAARTDRRRTGAAIELRAVAWVSTDGSGGDGALARGGGRHREIRLDHVLSDDVPAVEAFGGGPAALAEPAAKARVGEHGQDGLREVLRVVPDEDVLPVGRGQAFAPDGRADDGLPHRP